MAQIHLYAAGSVPKKVDGTNLYELHVPSIRQNIPSVRKVHDAVVYSNLHQISPETIHAAMHGAYPKYL